MTTDDDDTKNIKLPGDKLKKVVEPHLVGHTEDGKHQVFAPVQGPLARAVAHLKGKVWVCSGCRTTVHRRDAMVDPETTKVYHRGSCFDNRNNSWALEGLGTTPMLLPRVDKSREKMDSKPVEIDHSTIADSIEQTEETVRLAVRIAAARDALHSANTAMGEAVLVLPGINDPHIRPWIERIIDNGERKVTALIDNLDMVRWAMDKDEGGSQ